ncbi:unnamed protein product [Blepharisma stoltei]|uniref:Rab-GAP TBC domain-containing protein n=1 Tax=Blepharisma stoltei TaxID=1481888 RepID=A0AAU9JZR2_9CILI|nr:unnamed protein product [Blepharisma stoltei]
MKSDIFEHPKSYLLHSSASLSEISIFFKRFKRIHEEMGLLISDYADDFETSDKANTLSAFITNIAKITKDVSNEYFKFAENLESQIAEALESYKDSYIHNFTQSLEKTRKALRKLGKARENLNTHRNEYFKAMVKAEKAEFMQNLEDDTERIELATRNTTEMKLCAEKASEKYFGSLAEEKKLWNEYENSRKLLILSLHESEEGRVVFVKKSLEKMVKLEKKLYHNLLENVSKANKLVSEINPAQDAKEFEINYLGGINPIEKEGWITYEAWRISMKELGQDPFGNEEEYISSDIPYTPMHNTTYVIKSTLFSLIPKKRKISMDSMLSEQSSFSDNEEGLDSNSGYQKCIELLQIDEGKEIFFDVLESVRHCSMMDDIGLQKLGELFFTVMDSLEKDFNDTYFYKIVMYSHLFYAITQSKKFLYEIISSHSIFKNQNNWIQTIDEVVNKKIIMENEQFHRTKKKILQSGNKSLLNGFDKFSLEKAEKNSSLMTLGQFIFYMSNICSSIDLPKAVVLEYSKKSNLESDKILHLIRELYSAQSQIVISPREISKSLKKRSQERAQWGFFLHFGLCLQFLCRKDVLSLLFVCKSWNSIMVPYFQKFSLLKSPNFKIRKTVWASILRPTEKANYNEILEQLKANKSSIKDVENIISMDILRSYSNNPMVDSESLKNILQAYSFYRTDVGYCQGMNYIAGTLYLVNNDESFCFWGMSELIRKFKMENLYATDLSKLKYLFYVLDRLIALFLPNVHKILNTEMMTSAHFASPWFLTLFAGLLNQNQKHDILFKLWDHFLYYGWKIMFKASLVILKKLETNIISQRFEEIMSLLTSLHGSFCSIQIFDDSFITEVLSMKVTNRILRQIHSEYESLEKIYK